MKPLNQRWILTDIDGACLDWEYAFDVWMQQHGFQKQPNGQFKYDIGARYGRVRAAGVSATVDTWSLGPLVLSLPLLGRDRLQREADAAQARFEAAGSAYASTVRQAVSEVEQALVSLAALAERTQAADVAVAGYRAALAGTEARWGAGLYSLNELEVARRVLLATENTALSLRQERLGAWLRLYVALGGGFEPATASADDPTPNLRDAS